MGRTDARPSLDAAQSVYFAGLDILCIVSQRVSDPWTRGLRFGECLVAASRLWQRQGRLDFSVVVGADQETEAATSDYLLTVSGFGGNPGWGDLTLGPFAGHATTGLGEAASLTAVGITLVEENQTVSSNWAASNVGSPCSCHPSPVRSGATNSAASESRRSRLRGRIDRPSRL